MSFCAGLYTGEVMPTTWHQDHSYLWTEGLGGRKWKVILSSVKFGCSD
jgi:hypothetical protein